MDEDEREYKNSLHVGVLISEFIGQRLQNFSHTELTYGLLYAALALNSQSKEDLQFLDEAFNFEVLPMALPDCMINTCD